MKRIVIFGHQEGDENLTSQQLLLRKFANIFSIAFHPMMLPIYAMIYLLYFNPLWGQMPTGYKTFVMLYVGVGTSILPLVALAVMVMLGIVGDPEMPNKSERVLPLVVSTIIVGITWCFTNYHAELPMPMLRLTEGMFWMLVLASVVTPVWKISLHGMGVGAYLVFVTLVGLASWSDFSGAATIAFGIAGIVGWARLYLGSHTPLQLLWGQLAGMAAMAIAMLRP